VVLAIKGRLEQTATHDQLYDAAYYQKMEVEMVASSKGIAASLIERLNPTRVIDVGCGNGSVLSALREDGVPGIGFEYSNAAIRLCHDKGLDVRKFDIESDTPITEEAPVVICTEVAEHIPAAFADRLVSLLCSSSTGTVVMTAATPGQGGTDHVNEQPNEYWIEKFARLEFKHDPQRTQEWCQDWKRRKVDMHRANNVMVFSKTLP
jgi:SAM-dependent methyltransferase